MQSETLWWQNLPLKGYENKRCCLFESESVTLENGRETILNDAAFRLIDSKLLRIFKRKPGMIRVKNLAWSLRIPRIKLIQFKAEKVPCHKGINGG